jgi:hypothetical protein
MKFTKEDFIRMLEGAMAMPSPTPLSTNPTVNPILQQMIERMKAKPQSM